MPMAGPLQPTRTLGSIVVAGMWTRYKKLNVSPTKGDHVTQNLLVTPPCYCQNIPLIGLTRNMLHSLKVFQQKFHNKQILMGSSKSQSGNLELYASLGWVGLHTNKLIWVSNLVIPIEQEGLYNFFVSIFPKIYFTHCTSFFIGRQSPGGQKVWSV